MRLQLSFISNCLFFRNVYLDGCLLLAIPLLAVVVVVSGWVCWILSEIEALLLEYGSAIIALLPLYLT